MKKYSYNVYMIGNYDFPKFVFRDLRYKLGGHYTRGTNSHFYVSCYSSFYHKKKFNNYLSFGKGHQNKVFENVIKTNYLTISNYLEYIKYNYKAKYYVLTLWGHGYTWIELLPLHINKKITFITIHELKYALQRNKIDIISFETCNGSSIETIYELKNVVKHFIGNCMYTTIDGIEHKYVLRHTKCPSLLCKNIVNNMKRELCPSYIKTKYVNEIIKYINYLVILLLNNKSELKNLRNIIDYELFDIRSIDLGFLLNIIKYNTKNKQLKKFVIYFEKLLRKRIYCISKKRCNYFKFCGLSIFLPKYKNIYLQHKGEYENMTFYKKTYWKYLFRYYYAIN